MEFLTLAEAATLIAQKKLSPVELTKACLDRVARFDGDLHAFILPTEERALSDAKAAEAEIMRTGPRGPLHGIPVVVKDNIEVRGLPGLAGSTALVGREARDAALVTRLRAAGAIVLASTNLSQWANIRSRRSTSGWSATGGLVGNPWALDRSAGGSSSGSGAAVAAGLAPLAVGTETDGSIVCPASLTGVVGLKPTVGAVPTGGVVPISASQDSPGPLGRSVDDVARLYAVLSGTAPMASGGPQPRFAAATKYEHLSHAAKALGVRPDVISKQVARLETDLGQVLLHRYPCRDKPMHPSDFGREVARAVQLIERRLKAAEPI